MAFFDLETTGLSESKRLVQIGVFACSVTEFCESRDGLPDTAKIICRVVNPTVPLEKGAKEITGFTDEQLKTYRRFEEVFPDLQRFFSELTQPVYLIAHNGGQFDFPLLQEEIRQTGKKLGVDVIELDTLPIFRRYGMSHGGTNAGWKFGLRDLYKRFFGSDPQANHDALDDAKMLAKCCKKISEPCQNFLQAVSSARQSANAW